jgi:3-phenylpropionate/trans-cinnamate dioxygenase ferredoxin subunit
MTAVRVCALSELDDGKPRGVEVGGEPVLLVRDGDEVHALRDVCSHAEVALSEGEVEGPVGERTVECWLHGSCFDLRTGEPITPPATEPVAVYRAQVLDGDVHVDLDAGPPAISD